MSHRMLGEFAKSPGSAIAPAAGGIATGGLAAADEADQEGERKEEEEGAYGG